MADDPKPALKRYPVLSTLKHGSKRFEEGSTVELTEEQAAPLQEIGVVGEAKSDKAAKKE